MVKLPQTPYFKPFLESNTTVSTWLELLLLMSAFLGTYQPFFSVFEVYGNISTVLSFREHIHGFLHYRQTRIYYGNPYVDKQITSTCVPFHQSYRKSIARAVPVWSRNLHTFLFLYILPADAALLLFHILPILQLPASLLQDKQ